MGPDDFDDNARFGDVDDWASHSDESEPESMGSGSCYETDSETSKGGSGKRKGNKRDSKGRKSSSSKRAKRVDGEKPELEEPVEDSNSLFVLNCFESVGGIKGLHGFHHWV